MSVPVGLVVSPVDPVVPDDASVSVSPVTAGFGCGLHTSQGFERMARAKRLRVSMGISCGMTGERALAGS